MRSNAFPVTVKLNYMQAVQGYEATKRNGNGEENMTAMTTFHDEENQFLLDQMSKINVSVNGLKADEMEDVIINKGIDYDWSLRR